MLPSKSKISIIYRYIYSGISTFVLLSCSEKEDLPSGNLDLVFPYAFHIQVPEYEYIGANGDVFSVKGDLGYETGVPDTVDNMPLIAWNDSLNNATITVAIFTQPIIMDQKEIINAGDVIWQWHSGNSMEGNTGEVSYSQGKPVKNEIILYDKQPLPLESGLYYWAVWAWTNSGTKVLQSSKALSFYVK